MARNYHQGKYSPRNLSKYQGDATNIRYLSSWERMAFKWLDEHPHCISWGSETVIVPYVSPVDGKPHRYMVDLKATFEYKDNSRKTFLIEIKPLAQCSPPKTRIQKRLVEETATFLVNQAKWNAAEKFAEKNGWQFIVVTEKQLLGK